MSRFLLSISIIFFGLLTGQILNRILFSKAGRLEADKASQYLGRAEVIVRRMQLFAMFGLNPIVTFGAFWVVRLDDLRYVALPLIGALAILSGGFLAYLTSRAMGHERYQTGAFICSGAFMNLGSFGSLFCYIFLGEASYALASMYRLLEEFLYLLVGYPIARLHGKTTGEEDKQSALMKILRDPVFQIYITSISAGLILNFLGVERPSFFSSVSAVIIPFSSFLLVTSIGYRIRFSAIRRYLRECLAISAIKFIVVPVIAVSTAFALGLDALQDGLVVKVVLIMSAMPPAFHSLIPPQLYGLDADLANSLWLFNTGMLAVVLPILYFLQGLM
jgi:predicted permease